MIYPTVVLVMIFGGFGDGGRAINTDLRFTDKEACQVAAKQIEANWLKVVCVEVR